MKMLSISGLAIVICTMFSCQDGPDTSGTQAVDSDSVVTGLENTRDQTGKVSTDVKPDTSSGQATTSVRSAGDSSESAGADDQFIKEQVEGNYNEISLAKLASKKSSDKKIKTIADDLISDHSKALDKLRKFASQKKLAVASAPSNDAVDKSKDLEKKQAADFDKSWTETLIEKHKATISKYESAAKSVENSDVRSFINETLPKLRMHLDHLMAHHSQIKS